MAICIIGVDCATDVKKVGLARGFLAGQDLTIDKLAKPKAGQSVSGIVREWLDPEVTTLLAIDAPLGWPEALGRQLNAHTAGESISEDPNVLFRREI